MVRLQLPGGLFLDIMELKVYSWTISAAFPHSPLVIYM